MSRVQDERDSFCKLILQKEPTQHLRIPPEFLRLYHHELPDTVILKGPSGNKWPAKLCKDIDFVYIRDDGWQKFHRDNALGNGEFLIFQYDRKNCFKVQVFDPTGVERLNVAGAKSTGTNNPSGRRPRGRPESIPLAPEISPCQNLPTLRASIILNSSKTSLIHLSKLQEEEMDVPDVRVNSEPGKHKNKSKNKNKKRQVKAGKLAPHFPVCKSRFMCCSLEEIASSSKENAMLGAIKETFTSDFPFFMSYVRRSTVEKAKLLQVPVEFAKEYFLWQRANIVLQNAEGKTWDVAYLCNANRHYFSGGWQTFVHDNKLKIGDVCIFELLNKKEVQVHIYR